VLLRVVVCPYDRASNGHAHRGGSELEIGNPNCTIRALFGGCRGRRSVAVVRAGADDRQEDGEEDESVSHCRQVRGSPAIGLEELVDDPKDDAYVISIAARRIVSLTLSSLVSDAASSKESQRSGAELYSGRARSGCFVASTKRRSA
jgi:hypothetical protein